MAQNKIDIVIISYYRPEFTWKTLDAINENTTTPHRVIVVDNGSDSETLDMLWDAREAGLADILVLLDKNYGLEPAKNIGLALVRSELYVDTDNDILVPPVNQDGDWLTHVKKLMEKDENLAAIALSPQVFIGANKEEMFKDAPEVLIRDFVGGSMRLMRTDVVGEAGGWRSNPKDMTEANRSEEKYICSQLRKMGYKVGYARDIQCYHMFGDDEQWGYGEVEHYHRDQWPRPKDSNFISYDKWYESLDNRS